MHVTAKLKSGCIHNKTDVVKTGETIIIHLTKNNVVMYYNHLLIQISYK